MKVSRAMGSLRLDPTRPAILVSGGIGAAPMLNMVTDAVATGQRAPLRLLLSNRTLDEIPFRQEIEERSRLHPDMRITWHVTSEADRITPEDLRRQSDELADPVLYVTGPAALVADVVGTLRCTGVPRSRIRLSKQTLPFPPERSS